VKKVQNEKGYASLSIQTDHEDEFKNQDFAKFCDEYGF